MNNKGFGIQELLAFIGVFIFCIMVVAVYGKTSINGNNNGITTSNKEEINKNVEPDYSESLDELTPVDIEKTNNEYSELEIKLMEASKHYILLDKNNNVVTLKKLQDEYLIGDLVTSNNTKCDGYVIYENNTYKPYIKCGNIYSTKNYDEKNLKN